MRSRARVVVEPPRLADAEAFVALVKQSRALHRRWVSPPDSRTAYVEYLARSRRDDYQALLVRRREDRAIVGAFNLSQIFYRAFCSAYLGYWVGAPFARQGYMAEAMDLVLDHAFFALKLHRVEANIQPDNLASKALVAGRGFRCEGYSPRYLKIAGRWRDHERWAITVEDLRNLRARRTGLPRGEPARRARPPGATVPPRG